MHDSIFALIRSIDNSKRIKKMKSQPVRRMIEPIYFEPSKLTKAYETQMMQVNVVLDDESSVDENEKELDRKLSLCLMSNVSYISRSKEHRTADSPQGSNSTNDNPPSTVRADSVISSANMQNGNSVPLQLSDGATRTAL